MPTLQHLLYVPVAIAGLIFLCIGICLTTVALLTRVNRLVEYMYATVILLCGLFFVYCGLVGVAAVVFAVDQGRALSLWN